ncbi:oligopeptide/dipeptide ABC transporter ATP-binding protein [Saccharopolyspora spinosa]|uniref:oligopeptide/dipeptide ABC transporter ATP-binding protein n=1 Tax=Saccharopolyspora spinosa TaxID=60894 RepID=UPI001ED97034|nr:oligopeptide/dipeptide ABC transporter ATP-binding protein [Saccharopolyspora spinosa]
MPLTGPVPSATGPPSGCPFRTRCQRADETCAATMPDPQRDAPGHAFRCHDPVLVGTSDPHRALPGSGSTGRDSVPPR